MMAFVLYRLECLNCANVPLFNSFKTVIEIIWHRAGNNHPITFGVLQR